MSQIDPQEIPQVPNSRIWKKMETEWKKYKTVIKAKGLAVEIVSKMLSSGKQADC